MSSKPNKRKAFFTALVVSLVLLAILVAGTLILDYYMAAIWFDLTGMIIGHAVGFLLIFCLVYRYELKEDAQDDNKENHNIY